MIAKSVLRLCRWLGCLVVASAPFLDRTVLASPMNLIVNGSFESFNGGIDGGVGRQVFISGVNGNGITGWTLSGVGDLYLHRSPDLGNAAGASFNFAQEGAVYLDLSGGIGGGQNGNHALISQAFATTPAEVYELAFSIGAAFNPSPTIRFEVRGSSSILARTLTAPAPSANILWAHEVFRFTADSWSTTLSFRDLSGSDDNSSFVDNVSVLSVSAVPEIDPAGLVSVLALVTGTIGLLERRRLKVA